MLRRPAVFLCGRVKATKQCKIPAAARCRSDWAHPERDDQDLRAVFDDAGLWRSIQYPNSTKSSRKGLFGHASLSQPADLPALTTITILKANTLVRRICDLPSKFASEATGKEDALLETAIQFDRLSDLLCSVIDPSECIRNVFNQPDWKLEAEKAYAGLCEYMNVLNTHVGLYQVIKAVLDPFDTPPTDPTLYAAYQVSVTFQRDFEKSGIHLPDQARQQFVSLNNDILEYGWNFVNSTTSTSDVPTGDIGLDAPAATSEVPGGASSHPSAEVRKKTWISQHPDNGSVNSLEALLKARLDLARLLGYENYAQLALSDKMAQSPSSVWKFLDALNEANRSKATDDARYLASLRGFDTVEPWDRDFCSMVIPAPRGPPLSPFFSVGTCVQGISRTLQRVFGISLHFAQAADEWTWDAQVRRIEVRDESGKLLGLIYMDLFEREGKGQGAAHYTVQCARKTSWDDEAGDAFYTLPEEQEAGQSSLRSNMESKKKQLPRVVLSFDFDQRRSGPTTLQWHQVETLFHEMGHAIHTMLGQTDFQNVSGTRCATDFVELPSILMEHFCASPRILQLYARHHETDQPLPMDAFESHETSLQRLSGMEQAHQITLSALDMAYHAHSNPDAANWTTGVAWDIVSKYGFSGSAAAPKTGVPWQMRFSHLAGYGATYYSYLLDRAMANKVWHHLFAKSGGLDREAGETYRAQVLKWGGGKDPWHCIADVLEMPELSEGGDKAMSIVGH